MADLAVTADRPVAMVSVRLSEILEDGSSLLVTRAQFNLCHRHGNGDPVAVVPGEEMRVRVPLDGIAHRFRTGNRLRIAISPCYWPWAWPSPEPVTLGIRAGSSRLLLPTRTPGPEDAGLRPLDDPAEPPLPPMEMLESGSGGGRTTTHDLMTGRHEAVFDWDMGGTWRFENGVVWGGTSVTTMGITEGDPLSAEVHVVNTERFEEDDLRVDIVADGRMTCTRTEFLVTSSLEVRENGTRLFARTWDHRFPRDHC